MRKLSQEYFRNPDTLFLARDLLGKVLCFAASPMQRAIITETEAYLGARDRASHAYGNRITKRTKTMFLPGGTAYIYLCYGIHHLFNIVTHEAGIPHAILLRGGLLLPPQNITTPIKHRLLNGPGKLTRAMGITTLLNGISLNGDTLWIEGHDIIPGHIEVTTRVGIDYAGEDALLPYRFIFSEPQKQISF